MASKLSLGSINSTLLKQKKRREEIEQIRYNAYKNLLNLKAKYNMSNQEFLEAVKYNLNRLKY